MLTARSLQQDRTCVTLQYIMNDPILVANLGDVQPGTCIHVEVGGRELAICNVDGKIFAIDGECPHAGGPLGEGSLDGGTITCPWHGACFDVTSGELISGPADEGLKTFPVLMDGDDIKIALP